MSASDIQLSEGRKIFKTVSDFLPKPKISQADVSERRPLQNFTSNNT